MGISGVKTGAKAWSDSVQRSDFEKDGMQSISALDKEKMFGMEDLGETLNKVADPNWVDPSKMRNVGKNQLDKDAFMTLLLTQMKNQDPTNPLKSHEMAAQLAQFTSLEKLSNIDSGIEKLRTDAAPNKNFEALSFIGKSVMTDSSKISRTDIKEMHDLNFKLGTDAQQAEVKIVDGMGNIVRNMTFNNLKSGKNTLSWNGIMDDGNPAVNGEFTFQVAAKGSNGANIAVETRTEGIVTGVNFTPKGPQVMVGKQAIDLSDIKMITQPDLSQQVPQAMQPKQTSTDAVKKTTVKPESGKATGAQKVTLSQGNLENVAMTQGLINKINDEGGKAGMGSGG